MPNNIQDSTILGKTHKYGFRVLKTVNEAVKIYQDNGDTLRCDAIMQEMKMSDHNLKYWGKENNTYQSHTRKSNSTLSLTSNWVKTSA